MSWSVVRTCARCGTRAEREVRTFGGLATVGAAMLHHLKHRDSDQGCPSCDPTLANDANIDLDEWRDAVGRARSRNPQ